MTLGSIWDNGTSSGFPDRSSLSNSSVSPAQIPYERIPALGEELVLTPCEIYCNLHLCTLFDEEDPSTIPDSLIPRFSLDTEVETGILAIKFDR